MSRSTAAVGLSGSSGIAAEMSRDFADEFVDRVLAWVPASERLREELHREPCLSGQEERAAVSIAAAMPMEMTVVADTGRIGRIGPETGPAVAIRAELDALPVVEKTGVGFASENGAMHACGHDVHQAALVAVARAAAEMDLPFAIVPFLQPREEAYPSGALDIARSGTFEQHGVAAVIGAHVHPGIPLGSTATGKGPTNAAADEIEIVIRGTGGHGAYPHEASNPITVLAHLLVGLEELVRRTVSPMHPAVLTVGRVQAGDAANVIPASASLGATLRTLQRGDRPRLYEAITAYVHGQAASYGVAGEVKITHGEPVLENAPDLVDRVDDRLHRLGIEVSEPMRSCGSDDFSYYCEQLPSVMAFVGVHTESADPQPSLHHECFLPTADAVRRVALTLAAGYLGACDLLAGPRPDSLEDSLGSSVKAQDTELRSGR